ncbi:hypothetical protein QZH41_019191 [Actinostola sp. cb2023]|nr:hypothetical protein QZH41_019191 [Actinostola sp. cb2023]
MMRLMEFIVEITETGPSPENIQLEPGTTGLAIAGIVRVYHNGQWGTVCHHNFGMNDAKVACRQLGFTKALGPMHNGRGSGKVWLYNMQCSGSETSLHSMYSRWMGNGSFLVQRSHK